MDKEKVRREKTFVHLTVTDEKVENHMETHKRSTSMSEPLPDIHASLGRDGAG